MSLTIMLVLAWCGCGVLAYGITLGHHTADTRLRGLPAADWDRSSLALAVFLGLIGPLGLFVSFFMSGFVQHGLQWRI